jgi:glycosyltransferase involved in cell wall biosynthesis
MIPSGEFDGVIILGKIPPPYFGPAIGTEIILNSELKNSFNLFHIDTRLNKSVSTIGKFSIRKVFQTINILKNYLKHLRNKKAKLVLIPISQETAGLLKDSIFIIFGKLFRKKVILHLRGSSLLKWYNSRNSFWKIWFKRVVSRADAAIVLGEKLRYIFKPFLPEQRIFTVHNGGNFIIPEKPEKLEVISVLYVGNLMPAKGIEDLLMALKNLGERPNISLNVMGEWTDSGFEKHCKEIVRSQDDIPVTFLSPKTGIEKMKLYSEADIFVFPPRMPEGHPWVIIEAMAAGLPIITTDQGAIAESVLNGINGFIVEHSRPEQIADRLSVLVNESFLRERMGLESKKLYKEKFTEEKMVENLKRVFDTVLSYH